MAPEFNVFTNVILDIFSSHHPEKMADELQTEWAEETKGSPKDIGRVTTAEPIIEMSTHPKRYCLTMGCTIPVPYIPYW